MVASSEVEYAEEVAILQWDADLLPRKVEDSRFANHRTDAALYAYRECRHYLYKEKPKMPAFQSPDYWKLEERLHLEQLQRELKEATTWEAALY